MVYSLRHLYRPPRVSQQIPVTDEVVVLRNPDAVQAEAAATSIHRDPSDRGQWA